MTKNQLKRLRKLSKQLHRTIDLLNDTVRISAQAPDGMPFSNTNSTSSPVEDKALDNVYLYDRYMNLYGNIMEIINTVSDDKLYDILRLKYINFKKFRDIAKMFNKTEDALYSYYQRKMNQEIDSDGKKS